MISPERWQELRAQSKQAFVLNATQELGMTLKDAEAAFVEWFDHPEVDKPKQAA